jgi:hypothetical protein
VGFEARAPGDNAPVGVAVSLIVIAAGAILAFAVTSDAEGIDIDAVGWILIVVGLIGFVLSVLFWSSWGGPGAFRRREYVEGDTVVRRRSYAPRRTRVVEEEEAGPPAPPP